MATFYDGAGRVTGALEPFYSAATGYQDYRNAMPNARGTFTRYDEQSRPTCTWVQRANQPQLDPMAPCTSSSADVPGFRLATELRYKQEVQPNRGPYGGSFFAVETVPPDVNSNGAGAAGVKKLLGPSGEELGSIDPEGDFVWVERDAVGREVASWREKRDRSLATRQPASTAGYDLASQVRETWDANSGTRTRRYDEAGRLTFITVNAAGDKVEYVYGLGSLGRVTEVNEVVAGQRKLVVRNHYDTPYLEEDPGYALTAGKLSWVEGPVMDGLTQSETTIIYGYDDAGRVARRDQTFRRLPNARFGVGTSYGADGRVLRADYVNAFSAALMHTVEYDSAGRPIRMAGQLGGAASTRYWEALKEGSPYGAYDALGRIPSMEADNGLVSSVRSYGTYSALLLGEHKLVKTTGDLFYTDATSYQGTKLRGFKDQYSQTQYENLYYPSGRMQRATATPSPGTVPGPVTQDYVHGFTFNGVGNLGTSSEAQDVSPQSQRVSQEDRTTFNYVSPAAGRVDDKLSSLTVDRLRGGAPQCSTAVTYSYDAYGRLLSRTSGRPCTERGAETFTYDLQGHLTSVTREVGESEKLWYGPSGELLYRQVGEEFIFYAGEYQTVRARGAPGCGASCEPQPGTVEVDAHVLLAGTRIASVKPSRTLYYYRTRLGTVVATSLGGGQPGAMYRYTPYGKVDKAVGETAQTRSELGYTNALMLSGGLVSLKARVYDPESKTFLQADEVDRLRYAYVQGDPTNLSDPTGLEQVDGAPDWGGVTLTPVMRAIGEVWAFWNNRGWLSAQVPKTIQDRQNAEAQARSEGEKQKETGTALLTEEEKKAEKEKQTVWTDKHGEWDLKAPCMNCHGDTPEARARQAEYYESSRPEIIAYTGLLTLGLGLLDAVLVARTAAAVAAGEVTATGVGAEAGLAERAFWGRAEELAGHFARHGVDVGATTAEGYAQSASSLLVRSQLESLPTKIDACGIIRVYDPVKNLFGAFNPNGTARTLFSPGRGAAYFADQPGVSPWLP